MQLYEYLFLLKNNFIGNFPNAVVYVFANFENRTRHVISHADFLYLPLAVYIFFPALAAFLLVFPLCSRGWEMKKGLALTAVSIEQAR